MNALQLGVEIGNEYRNDKVRQSHRGLQHFQKNNINYWLPLLLNWLKKKQNLGMNEIAQFLNNNQLNK